MLSCVSQVSQGFGATSGGVILSTISDAQQSLEWTGGTNDLVRYVVEATEGGKLLMLWYSSPGFHTQRTGAGKLQAKERPAGAAI